MKPVKKGAGGSYLPKASRDLRDREIRARAEGLELRNEMLRGKLIDKGYLRDALESLFVAVGQVIQGSSMSPKDRHDILTELATLPIRLEDASQRQAQAIGKVDMDQKSAKIDKRPQK